MIIFELEVSSFEDRSEALLLKKLATVLSLLCSAIVCGGMMEAAFLLVELQSDHDQDRHKCQKI